MPPHIHLDIAQEEAVGKSALSGVLKVFGHEWWGMPAAAGALVLISQWDHVQEEHRIKREFRNQVAARVGKQSHDINLDDVRIAGKGNAIGEAMERSRKRRNLNIAVTIIGVVAAVALAAAFAPALATLLPSMGGLASALSMTSETLGLTVAKGLISFAGFVSIEHGLEKIGEHRMGLSEPALKTVERNPSRQKDLSVSSQVAYLQSRQTRNQTITQDEIMTVFAKANPGLDAQIQRHYGAKYGDLSLRGKAQVLQEVGSQLGVAQMTDDINTRKVWARELAFAAYGQQSGVKRFEPRYVENETDALKQRVADLTAQLNEKVAQEPQKTGPVFAKASVSAAPLGQGNPLGLDNPALQASAAWQKRIGSERAIAQNTSAAMV